jgi:hypothetical protein
MKESVQALVAMGTGVIGGVLVSTMFPFPVNVVAAFFSSLGITLLTSELLENYVRKN